MPPSIRSAKIDENHKAQREQLWPEVDVSQLWHRGENQGFTTIPRTLPLFMLILNQEASKRVSETYLGLWARANDRSVVQLHGKSDELAFAAGFSGSRMVSTWESRIDLLEEIGAIKIASFVGKKRGYALIIDPYLVASRLHAEGKVLKDHWDALNQLALSTGAQNLRKKPIKEASAVKAASKRARSTREGHK
jgi:hypothetical protein